MIDGNTAAGLGLRLCGRNRRRVVSDHPVHLADGCVQGILRALPRRCRDRRAQFRGHPGGGRIGGDRHGAGRFAGTERGRSRPPAVRASRLMNEFLGLAYYAEVPCVIFDVQRVGPSTGMPTRTQQADILLCAYASHGDTRHVLLFPANPEECFYMAVQAFDLAERLQTPVFVHVRSRHRDERLDVPGPEVGRRLPAGPRQDAVDRGARRPRQILPLSWTATTMPFRTARCPALNPKGAYFTRGSGHNQYGAYTEDSAEYQVVLDRLKRKFANRRRSYLPKPELIGKGDSKIGIVSIGSCDGAVREAHRRARPPEDRRGLSADQGVSVQPRRGGLPEPACDHLRGGAESRCAAAARS